MKVNKFIEKDTELEIIVTWKHPIIVLFLGYIMKITIIFSDRRKEG